jgi:hypothetical protein
MGFNFPNTPTTGDTYTPVGGPAYKWDGEKWGATAPGADGVVHYDVAQSLTSAQTTQARSNIYAAPFDALAYNGMQINGSMDVSQENGTSGIAVSGASKYAIDAWRFTSVGAQVVSGGQSTTVPSGYTVSLQMGVSTASASPAASDYAMFQQYIEGYRVVRLGWGAAGASPISIGFWVFANRPGNYSGSIMNGAANRSYPFSFTINSGSTWEFKTITAPGDTTGSWVKDNGTGLQICISMMAGSTYQAPANALAVAQASSNNFITDVIITATGHGFIVFDSMLNARL